MITDHDPLVARALDDLAPATSVSKLASQSRPWAEVVTNATLLEGGTHAPRSHTSLLGGRSRRRLVAAAVVGATALAVSLPASALVDKWFLHTGAGGVPSSDISLVQQGEVGGKTWRLEAYQSSDQGLCFAASVGDKGGRSCGAAINGAPGTQPRNLTSSSQELAFTMTGVGSEWAWAILAGPTAERVATVQVALRSGRVVSARTFARPSSLALNVRFFAIVLPNAVDSAPVSITAVGSDGRILQKLDLSAVANFIFGK